MSEAEGVTEAVQQPTRRVHRVVVPALLVLADRDRDRRDVRGVGSQAGAEYRPLVGEQWQDPRGPDGAQRVGGAGMTRHVDLAKLAIAVERELAAKRAADDRHTRVVGGRRVSRLRSFTHGLAAVEFHCERDILGKAVDDG
jgi:hypothetical protein